MRHIKSIENILGLTHRTKRVYKATVSKQMTKNEERNKHDSHGCGPVRISGKRLDMIRER